MPDRGAAEWVSSAQSRLPFREHLLLVPGGNAEHESTRIHTNQHEWFVEIRVNSCRFVFRILIPAPHPKPRRVETKQVLRGCPTRLPALHHFRLARRGTAVARQPVVTAE